MLTVDGKIRKGVGNLGVKPTVSGDNPMGLEVWIFDFHEDIYGKKIRAHLVSYLRPERKFDSIYQLKEQISRDTIRAKETFSARSRIPFVISSGLRSANPIKYV